MGPLDDAELRALVGHRVVDRSGRAIGRLELVFDDRSTGRPQWMGIVAGAIRRQRLIVPAARVERSSPDLVVPWTREQVRKAPTYAPSDRLGPLGLGEYRVTVSAVKERQVRSYYAAADHARP